MKKLALMTVFNDLMMIPMMAYFLRHPVYSLVFTTDHISSSNLSSRCVHVKTETKQFDAQLTY